MTYLEAFTIAQADYGSYTEGCGDDNDSLFICPDCEEPILYVDYGKEDCSCCPICGFEFEDGE